MTTRRRRWDVLLSAALFLLLALLFVPECDDCYFITGTSPPGRTSCWSAPSPRRAWCWASHPTAGIWATCWG